MVIWAPSVSKTKYKHTDRELVDKGNIIAEKLQRKTNTEGDMTVEAGSLFQYSTTRSSFGKDGFAPLQYSVKVRGT